MSCSNKLTSNDDRKGSGYWSARVSGHLVSVAVGALAFASPALAAAPPAGTVIGNKAVATFESGGQMFSVDSNTVETTVNTIAGVELEADTTKSASVGGKVFFPHTVTNVGNAPDSFALASNVPAGNGLSLVAIYPDANCDGVPDTLTAIAATPALNPGEHFCVVTELDVSTTVTPGASATYDITATTTLSSAVNYTPTPPSQTNVDTVEFSDTAVFEFTKNMTFTDVDASGSVTPGDEVRVRLIYSNTGLEAATNVIITDPLPADLIYNTSSGLWSDGGTAPMTDVDSDTDFTNGQGDEISYSYSAGEVLAMISSVPAGRTGYVQFHATIDASASGVIENIATIIADELPLAKESNTSTITVDDDDAITVTLADTSTNDGIDDGADPDTNLGGAVASATDDDALANDIISESSQAAAEGGVVNFEVVIENHSNSDQFYKLTADLGSGADPFPAGTTFSFYTETGGPIGMDSILVPANGTKKILVQADLPLGFTRAAADPANQATVTATSQANPAVSNSTTLELANLVQGAGVDLLNDISGVLVAHDAFVDDGGAPWNTQPVEPGATATFTLVIENEGGSPDSFNLSYSNTNAPFDPGALQAGWQVVFRDSTGSAIPNTGMIQPGASVTVTAEVTAPATATPGDIDLFFRAMSATNPNVSDVKMDRVSVSQIADLSIRSDRNAQAAPGGVVVISHVLENVGNVAITAGAITYEGAGFPTFSETLYVDTNANGVHDPADTMVGDISEILTALGTTSLAPRDTVTLFSRVQVPSTSISGLSETATLDVSANLTDDASAAVLDGETANNKVRETEIVVSGDLDVVKLQGLDVNCTGDLTDDPDDVPLTQAALQGNPGHCIVYEITATNSGSADAENVMINDEVPAFTTLAIAPVVSGGSSGGAVAIVPAIGATGAIRSTHGVLIPGNVAKLTFTVTINE